MKLSLLSEEHYKSAVAVVVHNGNVLLGRSSASDDRKGLLCFPAGHIKQGETPEQAAVRECQEESGYIAEALDGAFAISSKPEVAFVHCRLLGGTATPNHEFTDIGWLKCDDAINRKDLYPTNVDVLNRIS